MTQVDTGEIEGFGRVSVPEAPQRVSSRSYRAKLRVRLVDDAKLKMVLEAIEENDKVDTDSIKPKGSQGNYTLTFEIDVRRSYNPARKTYEEISNILCAIKRKSVLKLVSTPSKSPAPHKRQHAGRR